MSINRHQRPTIVRSRRRKIKTKNRAIRYSDSHGNLYRESVSNKRLKTLSTRGRPNKATPSKGVRARKPLLVVFRSEIHTLRSLIKSSMELSNKQLRIGLKYTHFLKREYFEDGLYSIARYCGEVLYKSLHYREGLVNLGILRRYRDVELSIRGLGSPTGPPSTGDSCSLQ